MKLRHVRFVLCFVLLASTSCHVQDTTNDTNDVQTQSLIILDISSGLGNNRLSSKAVKHTLKDGILFLDFPTKNKTLYVLMKNPPDVKPYKYLSLRVKSKDKKRHLLYVHLRKNQASGEWAQFYSIIETTPEWHTVNLNINCRTNSRSKTLDGFFRFTKGSDNSDKSFKSGGALSNLCFTLADTGKICVSDILLTSIPCNNNHKTNNNKRTVESLKRHPLHIPYRFNNVDHSREIILADSGKTSFVIIFPENACETIHFAADELAKYLKLATGANFKCVSNAQPGDKNAIVLSIDTSSLKMPEAFRMETTTNHTISITGGSPRGLLYGVYDFLEKAVGIRWFAPFDYGEVIPHHQTLKLPFFKDASRPLMDYRRFHYCSHRNTKNPRRYQVADWCVKNRYNVQFERLIGNRDVEKVRKTKLESIRKFYSKRGDCIALPSFWGHNFHFYVPPEKYFETHPEYFCFDRATGEWREKRAQICTSNKHVAKIIADFGKSYFKQHPERKLLPLCQEDGSRLWCQCPKCLALMPPFRRNDTSYNTDRNINLANIALTELRKTLPDKKIITYAYHSTASPPDKIIPLPGVHVQYCVSSNQMESNLPVWDTKDKERIVQWNSLCSGGMIIYSYIYLGFVYQNHTDRSLVDNFRYYAYLGIKGSNQETSETWGLDDYAYYLCSRLAWDPWFDTKTFEDDYFTKLYGSAAQPMQRFRSITQEVLSNPKYSKSYNLRNIPCFPPDKLDALRICLEKAEKIVENNPRMSRAVFRKRKVYTYICQFSATILAGESFFKNRTPANYEQALKELGRLEKMISKFASQDLVTNYHLRHTKSLRKNLSMVWKESIMLEKMKKHYNIIEQISCPWKFQKDPKAIGDKEHWYDIDLNDSTWNTLSSGKFWEEQGHKYDGTAWYRTKLRIPNPSDRLALYFGGVDERAWVWLDGHYIGGHHEGDIEKLWKEPFTIQLPQNLKPGNHQLTVKVIDSGGGGGIWKPVFLVRRK